jgi:hypothetical protein
MATDKEGTHSSLGSAGNAALGAAGEAAAFLAGAPIAGAADSTIVLGEVVAEREAMLEEAITGKQAPEAASGARSRWLWVVIAGVVGAIWLVVALR